MALLLEKHIVPSEITDVRLSDYGGGIFKSIPSRKGMKKAIDRGEVRVNGQPAGTGKYIGGGDLIELFDLQTRPPKPYEREIEVVFEDDFLAIVNKPAGLMTVGNAFKTLQNCLTGNLSKSKEKYALKYPRPVHRLDAATSGLVLTAKTPTAQTALGKMFAERDIKKKYAAIVTGKTEEAGNFAEEIDGKSACTRFEAISVVPSLRNDYLTLLHLYPETGRTHQIRKHTAAAGHPIFGDKLYGKEGEIYRGKGLFLAAIGLTFIHPITEQEMSVHISPPHKFASLLLREERRWKRLN